jgi:hypothetical protein
VLPCDGLEQGVVFVDATEGFASRLLALPAANLVALAAGWTVSACAAALQFMHGESTRAA